MSEHDWGDDYDDSMALTANRLQDRVLKLEAALRDCRATLQLRTTPLGEAAMERARG